MIDKVKIFLEKNNLINPKNTYLIGFSGGYDSMCMLDILHKISLEQGFKLAALHLNHNWRGNEAKQEEENCKNFCQKNSIDFYTETLPEGLQQTETVARQKRHEFFKKYYKKLKAKGLFLAHTKSDNTETVLYRIIKGTGVRGLCGILEQNQIDEMEIYRPLMNFSRHDILQYCKKNNLNPNNDSSNSDTKYARNFIRHNIVPQLKKLNEDIEDSVSNLSQIAISEQNIIKEYLSKIKTEIKNDDYICTKKFMELSKDVQNKLVLDFLIENNIDYDSKKVAEIVEFIDKNKNSNSGKTLSITKDLWLYTSKEKIYKLNNITPQKNSSEVKITDCGEYLFNNQTFKIEEFKQTQKPAYPPETEFFAYINIEQNIDFTLRTRRPGDVIQPFGMKGTMKLKKYLINKGIEKFKRDEIMLLCKNEEVLWIPGFCLSEKLKVENLPTHKISV